MEAQIEALVVINDHYAGLHVEGLRIQSCPGSAPCGRALADGISRELSQPPERAGESGAPNPTRQHD